jgi:hypothetical protein
MKKYLLAIPAIALYVLHQDLWFWKAARPLVFGFLPVGLFYHGCFSIAACLLMVLLVRHAWPSDIEEEVQRATHDSSAPDLGARDSGEQGSGQHGPRTGTGDCPEADSRRTSAAGPGSDSREGAAQ